MRGATATTSASTNASSVATSPRARNARVANHVTTTSARRPATRSTRRFLAGRAGAGGASAAGGWARSGCGETGWSFGSGGVMSHLHLDVLRPRRRGVPLHLEEVEEGEDAEQEEPGEEQHLLEGDHHRLPGHQAVEGAERHLAGRDRIEAARLEPLEQRGEPLLHLGTIERQVGGERRLRLDPVAREERREQD